MDVLGYPEALAKSCCAQPGHKKQLRQHQLLELTVGDGAAVLVVPIAARPTAFTVAAQAGLMDSFLSVVPDMQTRVLEKYAFHVKELKRRARHG